MLLIGRAGELVVVQITDDTGKVTGQAGLTIEAANIATKRIMDTIKEIKAAKPPEPKSTKPKK